MTYQNDCDRQSYQAPFGANQKEKGGFTLQVVKHCRRVYANGAVDLLVDPETAKILMTSHSEKFLVGHEISKKFFSKA